VDKAPDAFRTISEVAEDLDLPQHVLRFWETRFSQIKPLKRGGGRRYYRPDDVELLRGIRHLLYGEGYTIKGVQRILKEEGPRYVMAIWREPAGTAPPVARPATRAPEPEDDIDEVEVDLADSETPDAADDDEALDAADARAVRSDSRAEPPARVASPRMDEPAQPDTARLLGSNASLLSDADITRLQSVLFDLGECRRLIAQALAGDAAEGES
jgi:DNA-binding transcriptional MerR regulator